MDRRFLIAGLGVVLAILLAVVLRPTGSNDGKRAAEPAANIDTGESAEPGESEEEAEGEEARGGAAEAVEEAEVTEERLEALAEARASGEFGRKVAATTAPAPGWVGSRVLHPNTDDWEPAVAADPKAPFVYLLTTRYASRGCAPNCPTPWIPLKISKDGGATWSTRRMALCWCAGKKSQHDPTIEVVRKTGDVYAVFLSFSSTKKWSTLFTKSTNHGKTWSKPVPVYGKVAWTDKPEITMSPSGKHVFVSWNGPRNGDLYVGISHDYGKTWTQKKLSDSSRYYYAYDAHFLRDRTVVFSESSIQYDGADAVGRVWHHAVFSHDKGKTWKNVVVAKVPVGESCVADGCSSDFYLGQTSVVGDAPGHLVLAYEGPTTALGPQEVYISTSTNGGRSWSTGIPVSVPGENATGPRLASSGGGDVRVWYMQTAGHDPDAWNVWYRSSSDGGANWSSPVKISDAPAGAAGYVNANGFGEIYGDYGEIAVTSTGKTIATWGEGFSYTGPGGTWFNIQR